MISHALLNPNRIRVLLIGNYENDQQQSMQAFAELMLRELNARKINAELICPQPYFGKLRRTGHGLGKWLGYIDKFLVFPLELKRRLKMLRAAARQGGYSIIVHVCDHSNAVYTRYLTQVPHVVTCHDLLAVRSALGEVSENPTKWSGKLLQKWIMKGLNRATHVVSDSIATENDVRRLSILKTSQLSVIPISLNYPYSAMLEAEARSRLHVMTANSTREELKNLKGREQFNRYFFHVGGNQWYKNRMGVLRIYQHLLVINPNTPSLIMAGKPFTEEMLQFIAEHNIEERVISLESCTNEDLRALYSLADLLLFPSLAEGFGWPLIEAQACDCPVVCSSIEPLLEVAGDAAVYIDPLNEQLAAEKILRLLSDRDAREKIMKKGRHNIQRFTCDEMIEKYLDCYLLLVNRMCP